MSAQARRLFFGFLVAVLLGCVIAAVNAEDDCDGDDPSEECLIIYFPGACQRFPPYSYWWYFFDCFQADSATLEAVMVEDSLDGTRTTRIERTHPDGSVSRLVRHQKKKK